MKNVFKPIKTISQLAKIHGKTDDFIRKQLKQGIDVEMEHTKSRRIARVIASHHIAERPDYYILIKKYNL